MAEMDRFFKLMVEHGTSDLHLCTDCKPMFRKDGAMVPLRNDPETTGARAAELLFEIMPEKNKEEFRQCNDTDFAYELEGSGRYRCNIFRDNKGMGGVFRLIPEEILTFEQLNLPGILKKFCMLHKGLVLVTGPTGSGKSTTLAAMIDFINKTHTDHIITIEDPIEFVHRNQRCLINQRGTRERGRGRYPGYFPMQKEEKMVSRISSGVVSPVISPRAARACCNSRARNSGETVVSSSSRSTHAAALRRLSF